MNRQNCRIVVFKRNQCTAKDLLSSVRYRLGELTRAFFKDRTGNAVTIDCLGLRYCEMLNDFLFDELDDLKT